MRINFATNSYKHESPEVSSARVVNAYSERQPKDAKTDVAILGSPGIVDHVELGEGPVRGAHVMDEIPHFVSGDQLWSVDSEGEKTFLGAGIGGSGPVSMDNNGDDIVITNGTTSGWYYNSTDGVVLISDAQFYGANTVTFLDSRFLFDRLGINEFFHSDILDGSSYPANNSGAAETSPDLVTAVKAHLQTLFVVGSRSIEPWKTTADTTFPYQIVGGATVQRGSYAPYSIISEDNSLWFMGDDKVFYRMNGLQLIRVSNHAVEGAWSKYSTIEDASAFSYTHNGHKFICINFPAGNATWEFDIATGLWHERESLLFGGEIVRWRGNCSCAAYGKTFIGDSMSGKVGYIDSTVFTEFGDAFSMVLVSPPIHGDGARVFMPWFELDMATGVGLTTGQGSDPQVILDWSEDGGHTFIAPQEARSIGKIGERNVRLQWDRLGSFANSRIMRVTISDPVRRTVLGARCPGLKLGVKAA